MRGDAFGPGALVLVALAEHQRVDASVVGLEHRPGAWRGDDERRCVGVAERDGIARGEIDPADAFEAVPLEVVAPERLQTVPERDDRSLYPRPEECHRTPGRLIAPGDVHPNAPGLELIHGGSPVRVPPERAEEVDLGAQLGEHPRRYGAAAAGADERIPSVEDLPLDREVRHRHEVHPFDVADYANPRHAR